MVDYLLARAVRRGPSRLTAESAEDSVSVPWRLADGKGGGGEAVHESVHTSAFRFLLARVGAHYLRGQLYGGASFLRLRCGPEEALCFLAMCNESRFWLRLDVFTRGPVTAPAP